MNNQRGSRQAPQHKLNITPGGPNDDSDNNEYKYNKNINNNAQKYAIVSIMGPQSSGKSTILNKLFVFWIIHKVDIKLLPEYGSCPKGIIQDKQRTFSQFHPTAQQLQI